MRFFASTLLTLLLTAGIASAQVAAPSLNPTPTLNFAPGNPAVLPWDGPSRLGLSYGQREHDLTGAPVSPAAKGDVSTLAAQWIGERFAAGAAIVSLSDDFDAALGGGSLSIDAQVWTLAAQFAERYSLGLAYLKARIANPPLAPSDRSESTPLIGGTLRLGEFYLGLAGGTGTVEDKLSLPDQVKRPVRNLGVAYFWREKDRGVHAEVYHSKRDAALDAVSGFSADEEDILGYTLEAIVGNFLLGYQFQTNDGADFAGAALGTQEFSTITLGYVPAPGWSIVATKFDQDSFDAAGAALASISTTSLGVALRF